jgi:hypothetical protein
MPQRASTQSTLSIIDIKEDVVILTGKRYRAVFEVKAINFDLLSEDEQDSIIYAYASLINSLSYPIQILVKTRQLNITAYLDYLERAKQAQPSTVLKGQISSYQEFVEKLVIENNVLFKTFYVVLQFDGILVNKASIFDPLTNLVAGKSVDTSYSAKELTEAKEKLNQMCTDLMAQFQRIGLRTDRLSSRELVGLYYSLYNPEEDSAEQRVGQEIEGYASTMVHPSVR